MFSQWFKNFHWALVFSLMALTGIGVLFIYSASHYDSTNYALKQLTWSSIGIVVFFVAAHFSYRLFIGASYLLYSLAILLLITVYVLGETRFGAQRWLHLGPFAIQPSEFAKLATVLALANYLGSRNSWENTKQTLLGAFAIVIVPAVLIMKQPDLGSSLLFVPMILAMFLIWGIRYRYLVGAALTGLLGAPILWSVLKAYQKKRILVFLNPGLDPLGSGYTAIQSRIAVGSGGFWGKGFLQGTQAQLEFVPEHHTDFIFCVIGEEWGFLGTLFLLICYAFLFRAIFQVIASTTDIKAKLISVGIASVLFAQVFINIGMSFGLMPITGLTLPLISYGGSSFVVTALALGIILNVYRERSIFGSADERY